MERWIARILIALVFAAGFVAEFGCASKKLTPETPVAAAAMKADAVVIRVNELQAAVIEACGPAPECQPNSIPTATARDVVKAMIDLRTVLRSTPAGWQATVRSTWTQAKARLAGVTNPAILSAIALVNAAVEAL